tara:strand:- start:14493 stop:15044 length:552 start_codon:yes stop_codon:yes gene_type:complete
VEHQEVVACPPSAVPVRRFLNRFFIACVVLLSCAESGNGQGRGEKALNSIADIRALSETEFQSGRKFQIEATLLGRISATGQMYVHPDWRGILIAPAVGARAYAIGSRVEVSGTTGGRERYLIQPARMRRIAGSVELPKHTESSMAEALESRSSYDAWMQLSGTVQAARRLGGRMNLTLRMRW